MFKTVESGSFELSFDDEDVDDENMCEIEVTLNGRINIDDIAQFRSDLKQTAEWNIF